uniref:RRM domain-containing protein n=1 Tax=Alexandrium monilatum TaxID=311494 RepID=A0A7S4SM47_9DINO
MVPPIVGPVPDAALPGLGGLAKQLPARPSGAVPAPPAQPPAPPLVTMTVQQELVGMLIGKGGETVKQLSKDSGARIEISKTGNDGPNGERTVYLSGSNECIDKAKQMIEDTLSKARERTGVNNPNAFIMKVPHELVGMLIGKGGETIKELKKESGARIDISKEPTESSSNDRLVHISGPPECVEFAKKMVEEMLGRARERHGLRRPDEDEKERERSPDRRPTQTTIQVPHELIGMLIGKGGETIKTISKDSGARIEIAKDENAEREEKRSVYLCGPPDSLEKAKAMIEETLGRSRERQHEDRDTRVHHHSGSGPKVIHVAPELVGMLIGKGGETIKQVSRDTGARIEISKDDRDNCDRTVTISGSPDAIDRARDAIDDVLDRARERLDGRSERRSDRRDRGLPALTGPDDAEESALVPLSKDRRQSPVKDSFLSEKVYVDEVEMPFRPCFLPEHEDGLPTDLEIFVRGLPRSCAERDLWEHLYRLGATDVKEILLLRRQKQSKGMAYVVFNRHDHAMMAKAKLNHAPAASVPCGGQLPTEERGSLAVRFSESERCINGRSNVYGTDMVGLLLGSKGKCMQLVKEESRLRKVLMTGRNMKSFGQVDEDPRLHMVVYYEADEADNVAKAVEVWGEQLSKIHKEIVEKQDRGRGAKGYGKGKGWPEYFEWGPPHPDFPRPPFMEGPPQMRPPPPPEFMAVEAPVLLQRRRLAPPPGEEAEEGESPKLELTGPKILEATCLRGRELRWQPWPDVTKFNEEWKALPLRWGLRGELFVLLQRRDSGEARVCGAEVHLPLEKWPVLNAVPAASPAAARTRYKSFTFNEHLFLISIDRESGTLKVFHVPDPSSNWDVAFETTLPKELGEETEGMEISRSAKMYVFYTQDRVPHVLTVEPEASGDAPASRIFRIAEPGKAWTKLSQTPKFSSKARLLPVYTKTRAGTVGDFEVSIFSVDKGASEIAIHHVPRDADKPWVLVSTLPFAGDTRLSCIYVPGKPEPLLMAGSPTERMQKLCHLNLIEWCTAKLDERMSPPKAPVVEEKFSRQMSSLWPEGGREGTQSVAALPIDCTADLPVSRHLWVTVPIGHGGDLVPLPDRPMDMRMPFGYPPYGQPPFDPRGPPPFDFRPPPFGRPPFDDRRPPFDMPMGGKGFDPQRPPFDRPPPGWYDGQRPPFDRPPFGDFRPPFDGPPPDRIPPSQRPPFDGPPLGRPPFEAPPGDWFGSGPRPPFDPSRGPGDAERRPGPPPMLGPLEVGSVVEANFRERGQFLHAKVIAKHEDGTFDLEYDGDYIEWHVPTSRIRPPLMPPWGPPPGHLGAPDAPGAEGERKHRKHHRHRGEHGEGEAGERRRHHRHRRHRHGEDGAEQQGGEAAREAAPAAEAEGGETTEGGERKRRRRHHHHRHREERREGEQREASASPEGDQAAARDDAAPGSPPADEVAEAAPAAEAAPDAAAAQEGGDGSPPRRRHRHHRHKEKDPDRHKDAEEKKERDRSRSQDGERRKHRKRRHRSGDRDRGGGREEAREAAEASDHAAGSS